MVKKGHPLVLHLPVFHGHLLQMFFFWTNLSLFQFLQTEVTIPTRCSKQEEKGCKVLLKNLAEKRIIIKKLVIFQDLEEMLLAKTLSLCVCVLGMREETLEQAGQ